MRPGRRAALFILAGWFAVALLGCGRKLPPIPPPAPAPPPVTDLSHRVEENRLTLNWTVPAPGARGRLPVAGFTVERALLPAAEAGCADCPLDFQPVGEVDAFGQTPGSRVRFSETLTTGFRHFYRVRSFDPQRVAGEPSARVAFTF